MSNTSTPKKDIQNAQLSQNKRSVLFLVVTAILVYLIWGVYSGNFHRLYNYSSRPSSSITLNTNLANLSFGNISVPKVKSHKSVARKTIKSTTSVANVGPAQSDAQFSTYPAWSQNFSTIKSSSVNQNYWNVYQGIPPNSNNEAEYYSSSPNNVRISGGALTLSATKQSEPGGYQYASGRVDTENKKSFLYGRIDITAKLPSSVGTWPAVWFLPSTITYENLSPLSDTTRYLNGGEIDLIEEVGISPNIEYGIVHTLADQANPGGVGTYNTDVLPENDSNYYLYSLLWTPTTLTFEVDNVAFYSYTKPDGANFKTWPFDQPFYMIVNLALGGSWGGMDTLQFPNGIDNSALPANMDIQSIYYYSYTGN